MPKDSQVGQQYHHRLLHVADRWWTFPMCLARAAPPMETAIPMADIDQKGMISLVRWDRPPLPQTHFRFRK